MGRNDRFWCFVGEDGWLHTGDLGEIDRDGFLTVTEQKTYLRTTGRCVSPLKIEAIKKTPNIDHVVVIGDDRPFPTALVFVQLVEEEATRKVSG